MVGGVAGSVHGDPWPFSQHDFLRVVHGDVNRRGLRELADGDTELFPMLDHFDRWFRPGSPWRHATEAGLAPGRAKLAVDVDELGRVFGGRRRHAVTQIVVADDPSARFFAQPGRSAVVVVMRVGDDDRVHVGDPVTGAP